MGTAVDLSHHEEQKMEMKRMGGGSSEAVYGLGLFGAWFYYIGRAGSLQEGVVGFFKGLFWPAILVYELLEFLNKE